MSLLLFLAAAAVQTAPAPEPEVAASAPRTERVCKSVATPDSRLKKRVCTTVKVKEAAPATETATAKEDDEG